MIPNKINQSFMQGMQVLADAKTNGSRLTVSDKKNIHTQTIFERIFLKEKPKRIYGSHERNILSHDNFVKAKIAVAAALENEIKFALMLNTDGFYSSTADLNVEIENISHRVVGLMIDNLDLSDSKKADAKFNQLITEKRFQNNLHLTSKNKDLILNALSNVKEINHFALSDHKKFKFVKAQLNSRLEELKNSPNIDHSKKTKSITQKSVNIDHINNVASSAAWVQKNKWLDNRRSLGWAVGMNQTELKGLSNKDKFDINWKLVSSAGKSAEKNSFMTWRKDLKRLASEKKQQAIEKYLKSLPKAELGSEDVKQLAKKLLSSAYDGLNPAGRFQAFLAEKIIQYTDKEFGEFKEKTTTNTDIANAIKEIKREFKYQEI